MFLCGTRCSKERAKKVIDDSGSERLSTSTTENNVEWIRQVV